MWVEYCKGKNDTSFVPYCKGKARALVWLGVCCFARWLG